MGYRYIGSKARIADEIVEYIRATTQLREGGFFVDAFSGTGVVAEKAAQMGWPVYINDMMNNAIVMSEARLLSVEDVPFKGLGSYGNAINLLNSLPGKKGFVWKEYSPASLQFQALERKYFMESNAMKIDAITSCIHNWKNKNIITQKEAVLLLSDLIRAVNDIANIAGTYGCFLSHWTAQAKENICLQMSELKNKKTLYQTSNIDVFEIETKENDVLYLDPPYTKRQYASYYHILETIVCGDEPKVSGVSGLRPWKDKASVFCYKTKALKALTDLILKQNAKRVILSYSNEGHIKLDELVERLLPYGKVELVELKTIGRYRPNKVAVENSAEVKEYLLDFSKE